jgi:hypothetical protein
LRDNPLERRDLLKLAAGACLVGSGTGCGPAVRRDPASLAEAAAQLDPAVADALLAKMDRRMAWLNEASLPDDVLPLSKLPRGADFDRQLATNGALVRKAVRALYLTGRVLDLPDAMKVHPGVQSRLRATQPEMDDAVLGMTEHLERMTSDDQRRLQAHLKGDSLFGERLAHVLEDTVAGDGLSFQRTFGVRTTTLQATERMAAQSPALVIDPLVDKVRRIRAHPRTDAEEARVLASRMGEQAFWAHQERIALLSEAWKVRLGTAGALASTSDVAPPSTTFNLEYGPIDAGAPPPSLPPRPPASTPGSRTLGTGGIIMGFGLGSVTLGLIFAGLASATSASGFLIPALVLGVTVGPILLIVGLIVVVTGIAMKASE